MIPLPKMCFVPLCAALKNKEDNLTDQKPSCRVQSRAASTNQGTDVNIYRRAQFQIPCTLGNLGNMVSEVVSYRNKNHPTDFCFLILEDIEDCTQRYCI